MSPGDTPTYDIIFAGGGATACITAGRLAEADPSLRILIMEAGPHSRELHEHVQPGRYFSNLLAQREFFSYHFGKGTKATNERMHLVPAGRAVGGGSAVNFLMHVRPAASDYDEWETEFGNQGWGSKDLIPLLNKAETYQPDPKSSGHGHSGPLKVSFSDCHNNLAPELLRVAQGFEKNAQLSDDINDMSQNSLNHWGRIQRWVDGKTGRRSDAAHHYIYNQASNKNLTILTRKKVAKVIFEGTRAVGVEYVDDVVGRTKGVTEPSIVKASKLVVLSAGAFGSPPILERSGIGAKDVLEKVGVKTFIELPGVGKNYMDHNLVFVPYKASEDTDTMDVVFRGTKEEIAPHEELWFKEGRGLLANNGIDAGTKLRPTEAELKTMSPEFDQRWASYYENAPDKPVILMGGMAAYVGLDPSIPKGKYISTAYFSAYPASVGHVHITSAIDLYSPLDFVPGFLDNPADLVILRWAYKRAREIMRRLKFYRGELESGHPAFSKTSQAAVGFSHIPADIDAAPIEYTAEDDAAIDEYHRNTVGTTWHSCGTCAMKPLDEGGVVDSNLNVYGVKNLKIADISIMPGNVAANTYTTAIAIGEKAAFIIAQELGIQGVAAA